MIRVRIVKNWDYPDLLRQTPNSTGVWGGLQFTLEETFDVDYVIVLNYLTKTVNVKCPRMNVWAIMQEPFVPGVFDWIVDGHKQYAKVLTHLSRPLGSKYVRTQPSLPWHVDKTFDELIDAKSPEKQAGISWVTSDKKIFPGHLKRMEFFEFIVSEFKNLEVFGRGINEIDDKWDAIAPYKYSLAIENSSSAHYWTEKIADCFLCYSMPIYWGCTNIADYFPKESFVSIDVDDKENALKVIKNAVADRLWDRNFEAICEARRRVLHEYQLFPHLAQMITQDIADRKSERIELKPYKPTVKRKLLNTVRLARRRFFSILKAFVVRAKKNLVRN